MPICIRIRTRIPPIGLSTRAHVPYHATKLHTPHLAGASAPGWSTFTGGSEHVGPHVFFYSTTPRLGLTRDQKYHNNRLASIATAGAVAGASASLEEAAASWPPRRGPPPWIPTYNQDVSHLRKGFTAVSPGFAEISRGVRGCFAGVSRGFRLIRKPTNRFTQFSNPSLATQSLAKFTSLSHVSRGFRGGFAGFRGVSRGFAGGFAGRFTPFHSRFTSLREISQL